MKAVSKSAQAILESLTKDLPTGESRKFDSKRGYMPVHVERLTERTFSIAHYFEQNGDLVPDPDLVVWRSGSGEFFPVSIQQVFGFTRCLELDGNDQPLRVWPRRQRDVAAFATMMTKNIRAQQGPKLELAIVEKLADVA